MIKLNKINKLTTIIFLIIIIVLASTITYIKTSDNFSASSTNPLPSVGSYENLKKLVKESNNNNRYMFGFANDMALKSTESAGNTSTSDYSKTNIQVEGVDESDVVKTDGNYIYKVNDRSILVIKAYPAQDMKVINTLTFLDSDFIPNQIYLDDDYLTVIGASTKINNTSNQSKSSFIPEFAKTYTKTLIYDIKDKSDIKLLREVEVEGNLISSRKIKSNLYLVLNKYIDYYYIEKTDSKEITPTYKDTAVSNEINSISYEDIKYFPDSIYSSYIIIGSIDISKNEEIKLQTYLGSGQNIYASNDSLYIAETKYTQAKSPIIDPNTPIDAKPNAIMPISDPSTLIYKFKLKGGSTSFYSKGEVPGTILNQFSMDEYNKHFRIATTLGNVWNSGDNSSKNNVYILDESLNIEGKLEGLAKGEKIYSVRFMGDKAYIVTFRTVDPLFVLDLKNPKEPKVLGELKIPGYSDYLHPYDENHIIGFGKDSIAIPMKDAKGNALEDMAYYLGMKVAIFDVSDVNNPKEMFSTKIGDRGTSSDILYDHKALLFSKEKNLLAFPVSLYELQNGQSIINSNNHPEYGKFTYQGAYIYDIDLNKGLTLKGTITHLNNININEKDLYSNASFINRIIYINDTLYTLSNNMIKAIKITDLSKINQIDLK